MFKINQPKGIKLLKRFLVAAAAAVAFTAGGSVAAFASTSYQPDNYSHNVVNDKSGKCMDNTGFNWVNGNPVQQWTCGADGGVDQNLRLVNTDGYEALAFVQPGTDTSWYVTENGFRSQLTISDVPDESTQALTETNGVFTFTTSGLVADDRGQSVRNGAQVIGYTYNGGANQVWTQLADNHFQHHPKPGPVPVLDVTSAQSFTDNAGGLTSTGSNPLVITNAGDGPSDADMSAQVNYTVTVEDVSPVPVSDVNASLSDALSVSGTDSGNHDFSVTTTIDLTATPVDQSLSGHDGDVFSASLGESQLEAASYTITDNGVTHTGQSFSAVESVLNGATVSSASAVATPDVTATFDHGRSVAVAGYTPVALTASYGVLL